MWYCIKNVNETRTLKSSTGVIETITINTRGDSGSTLKIYDSTSADENNLIADYDIANVDSLIQFISSGCEFSSGLTYKTTGNPGNITIVYR